MTLRSFGGLAACIAAAVLRPCGSAEADSENVAQHGLPQGSAVSACTSVAWLHPLLRHQEISRESRACVPGAEKRCAGRVTEQV